MAQTALTVDEYIRLAPVERREALQRIRRLCNATLAGAEELIEHAKPTYKLDGTPVAGFASQAQHIAFYAYEPDVQHAHTDKFTELAEGLVQFNKADLVDYELIETLLHDTAEVHR